ncbi:type II toxin-antitoxin system VapC family toxin [Acidisoma silvae]|uniref:PIN domain nuclease n=1 Tax=Acidisoma silvae TaxID=2802396 RepID=A0A964DYV6_9PROT|nr:PIN domain nuclease [Acidisoma silvae]MCB8875148.1 PIN domain nuclease [Acidisoma silvae]
MGGRPGRHPLQPPLILVDSSVWINNLRGIESPGVQKLRKIWTGRTLLVGDLILMEILMGARSEALAVRLRENLGQFPIVAMSDPTVAELAARNYRVLRGKGITIRTGIDLLIGTFCIEKGHQLLFDDRDFSPMAIHLGLQIL